MKKLLLIAPLALLAVTATAHIYNREEAKVATKNVVLRADEVPTETEDPFLVYFKAPTDWKTVDIWAWDDSGTNPYTPLGWPGKAMLEDEANEGWYYSYVPGYVDQLIFSTTENGVTTQTNGNAAIPAAVKGGNIWIDGLHTVTQEGKDEEGNPTTNEVFEYNTPKTEQLTEGNLPEFSGERYAFVKIPNDWRHAVATFTSSTDSTLDETTLKLSISSDNAWFFSTIYGDYDTISVNNGEKDNLKESIEIKYECEDFEDFYITIEDEKTSTGLFNGKVEYEKPVEMAETRPIHVKVPESWDSCYIWPIVRETGTGQFTTWPGAEMTLDTETGWYTYQEVGTQFDTMIFSCPTANEQTADLEGVEPKEAWFVIGEKDAEGKYGASMYYSEPGEDTPPTTNPDTPDTPTTDDPSEDTPEEPSEGGLPAWGIALIVIGAVVVVGAVAGLVYYFLRKKK